MSSGLLVALELGLVIGVVLVIAIVDLVSLRRSKPRESRCENGSKSSNPF